MNNLPFFLLMVAVLSFFLWCLKSLIGDWVAEGAIRHDEERRKEFQRIAKEMIEQWEESKRREDDRH